MSGEQKIAIKKPIRIESRFGNMFFPSLFFISFPHKLFLFIDIAISKCYNACEKSLEILRVEGEGSSFEYFSC